MFYLLNYIEMFGRTDGLTEKLYMYAVAWLLERQQVQNKNLKNQHL